MWNWISALEKFRLAGQPLVLVTVTRCTGSTPRDTGAKMIVLPDGRICGTIGGGHLEQLAIQDAIACLQAQRSETRRYPLGARVGQCCGGIVELLMEVMHAGPRLYLFGGGHVGQAVCRTLAGTAFEVHLVEERQEWASPAVLPPEVITHTDGWELFAEQATWDAERTFVAIMTHQHDLDQQILQVVLARPSAYVGLIGSDAKWARFRQRLLARGVTAASLDRVRCPIGVGVGGKAPQEIAISVGAELLRAHYGERAEAPPAGVPAAELPA
jgi:xanthine dehydrogenase accessory factor